uniref:Polyprenal reductase n=1 Tax=Strongyloides papillosus TaxID=174720 RepID=A0A0N5BV24_STREA
MMYTMLPENFLQLYLLLGSIFILLLSISIFFDLENGNLKFIKPLLFYGKTLGEKNVLSNFSVPKSWFYIFYVIGEVLSLIFLIMIYLTPTLITPFTSWLYLFGYSESVQSYETTLLILTCLSIHIGRRLYETLFISVYSPSTIHISHFMMGIIHYIFLPLSVLVSSSLKISENISFSQVMFTILFVFLNYLQNGIANDFANLRKDENNKVTNLSHKVCLNGIHKFVCCPHFLYEILIYLTLYGIGRSQNLLYFLLFVLVNQMVAAKTNQIWYKKKFSDKIEVANRKALIPFIY